MVINKVEQNLQNLTANWQKAKSPAELSSGVQTEDQGHTRRTEASERLDRALKKPAGVSDAELAKFRQSASEFEAIFLEMVMKSMRNTVMKSGLIDGGNAEDIYQDMLDQQYSSNLAKGGMTGLAEALESQLIGSKNLGNLADLRTSNQRKFHPYGS